MGGEREDVIPQKEVTERGLEEVGGVRFHENAGEVHFHDDKNHRKVAVPVGVWAKAYQRLLNREVDEWVYPDPKNQTSLKVKFMVSKRDLDVAIKIRPMKVSTAFEKLHKFSAI